MNRHRLRAAHILAAVVCMALSSSATLTVRAFAATSLNESIRAGDAQVVRAQIEGGANLETADEDGLTPLLQAVLVRRHEITKLLLASGANPNAVSEVGGRVLQDLGLEENPQDHPRLTPLMLAVLLEDRAAVEALLAGKADVNLAAEQALTPLHLTVFNRSTDIASILLNAGANVEARSAGVTTPLHGAVQKGNHAIAALLLQRGADVNAVNEEDKTPLDYAYEQTDPNIIGLVQSRGGVAMQDVITAEIDVVGRDPMLAPSVDAATLERLVPSLARPLGVAVDRTSHEVYWTEYATGRIRRASADGAKIEELPIGPLSGPIGLAYDGEHRSLYWTTDSTFPRRVQRATLDGFQAADVVAGAAVNRPLDVVVPAGGDHVYWTESLSGRIRRSTLEGTNVVDLLSSGISSWNDRADASEFKILGLAVDERDGRLFWSEMLDGRIFTADPDGSNVKTLIDERSGLEVPAGVALSGDHIYWADSATAKIMRAKLDGSGVEQVLTADDGLIEPYALAIDAAAGRLYWTDASAGTVSVATLGGGDVRQLVAQPRTSGAADGTCAAALSEQGVRYVRRTVNAAAACIKKVDALKAVWRAQSDVVRALPTCVRQLARLDPANPAGFAPELRAALEAASCNATSSWAGPWAALLDACGDGALAEGARTVCIADKLDQAASSAVALRFRRAGEMLEEIRPYVSDFAVRYAVGDAPKALASLDRLSSALEAMKPRRADAAPKPSPAPTATGLVATYTVMTGKGAWKPVPDDGALRSGGALAYADNGDGTITDLNTGLMWEKKCENCGGLHDVSSRFALHADDERPLASAWLVQVNAENGSGFAGHSDWRLPTIHELQSIVDYDRFNPAVSRDFDGAYCGRGCTDLHDPACSCTSMAMYWSSTPVFGFAERAWALGFNLGLVADHLLTEEEWSVRAVRSAGVPK